MLLSPLLRFPSSLYRNAARTRREWYEKHPGKRRHLSRPVISVGNLTVGGSGKTPAVAYLARMLAEMGEVPAILSRGYRREDQSSEVVVVSDSHRVIAGCLEAGDEPLMLARELPGVPVVVCAERYRAGVVAERLGCTVHLLDDGFQHVRLHRDVDLVLLAPRDLNGTVLPLGRLREGPEALSRADAVLLTESAGTPSGERQAVALPSSRARFFNARTSIPPAGEEADVPVVAVAGIARPRRFYEALRAAGWKVVREVTFRDHHWYSGPDLERIVRAARETSAERVLTTGKDMVRLEQLDPFPVEIVAVPLQFTIEPEEEFRTWLRERLRKEEMA
jgi:tetraacyldisaccharide 4'-kinase